MWTRYCIYLCLLALLSIFSSFLNITAQMCRNIGEQQWEPALKFPSGVVPADASCPPCSMVW